MAEELDQLRAQMALDHDEILKVDKLQAELKLKIFMKYIGAYNLKVLLIKILETINGHRIHGKN